MNVLRSLKYKLNRNTLSNIYISYIRPILEYASVVWDECGVENSRKLEKVQLDAARVVTGLPCYASAEALYAETGWETLKCRRQRAKLKLFVKTIKGEVPEYLVNILPPQVGDVSRFPLRNQHNFVIPQTRLTLFKNYTLYNSSLEFFTD